MPRRFITEPIGSMRMTVDAFAKKYPTTPVVGYCCFLDGSEFLLKRNAVCIFVKRTCEKSDEVHKCPNASAHTGAHGKYYLDDAVLSVAEVEIVDTESAEEESEENSRQLGLSLSACRTFYSRTAVYADSRTGIDLCAAVAAEVLACAFGKAAIHASYSILI